MGPARRTPIGKQLSLGRLRSVFRTPEALEVDDLEHVQIRRSRVYFDEILLVTYHRRPAVTFVVLCGLLTLFVALVALVVGAANGDWILGTIVFAAAGLPLVALGVAGLVLPVHVISAYGRRSSVQLEFHFRPGR